MSAPVETVIARKIADSLFQVSPHQPDLHLGLLMCQRVGKGQKNSRARRAVISSDKSWFEECVVMASEDKDILTRIGADVEFADDVMDAYGTTRCFSDEIVSLNLCTVPLQDLMN